MRNALLICLMLVAATTTGCGSSPSDRSPVDSPVVGGGSDAASDGPDNGVGLPAWMLEDVQPESPRVGQTYGLDTFAGKIVVVTLLEGF